jgi:hypothetical protein
MGPISVKLSVDNLDDKLKRIEHLFPDSELIYEAVLAVDFGVHNLW